MLFVYAYTNHMQLVYDLYIFCIYHVQIIYTVYTICIWVACDMCESYAMRIVFTYDLHIICIWVAYHYMLTAFYVHMINIRSTYDLHASYIDYCWMFVGVNIVSFFQHVWLYRHWIFYCCSHRAQYKFRNR